MDALSTAHAATDKALDAMEKHVRSIYLRSVREIYKSWQKFFEKESKRIEKLQEDYEKAKKSGDKTLIKETGIALAREKKKETVQNKWFHDSVKQTAENLLHVNEKAVEYLNGRLPETYVTNFNAVGELCEGAVTGYSYHIVDENTVRELAMSDTSLLPYKEIDPAKDIAWNVRQMKSEVLQGILQGENMQTIAKRLSNVIGMNENSAVRNARTMVTAAENKGRQDGFYQAEEDGIILEKYWLCVHGERTREAHAAAGNDYAKAKSIPQSQPFIVGGEKLMFPGDNSMGASGWNLYNCRCSVAAVVKGFKKVQEKKDIGENQVETHSTFADGEQASQFFGVRPPRSLRKENREEYDRLLEEYRKSQFGSWYDGLSSEEITSIAEYTGDGYLGINGLLRGHMTEKMVNAWDDVSSIGLREMIGHIDDSISRFELKKGIKVYRTCEKDVFENLSAQVGSKFVDDGFVSTTALNKKVASGNVFMEIDVPPGTGRGAWINPISGSSDEEWEFLLQRGSVFEITDISDVGDDIVVKMKWTGIEKKDVEFASREDVIAWQKKNGLYDETEEYRI